MNSRTTTVEGLAKLTPFSDTKKFWLSVVLPTTNGRSQRTVNLEDASIRTSGKGRIYATGMVNNGSSRTQVAVPGSTTVIEHHILD